MFHWLRDHRRKEILKKPFPVKWREILEERVAHYSFLNSDEKFHLEQLVQGQNRGRTQLLNLLLA